MMQQLLEMYEVQKEIVSKENDHFIKNLRQKLQEELEDHYLDAQLSTTEI